MTDKEGIEELNKKANTIRWHVLNMITEAGSGHPGGSLSCVEIITTLYFHVMRHNPENPDGKDRDRFVLSKGHAAPTLYAALAESGYFSVDKLLSLRMLGGFLQGHPDKNMTPGVEISAGSLGNGLPVACGMALAAKLDGKNYNVYTLVGDGECDEGLIWEAAMFASHYKLDNLIAIVDRNGLQIDGPTELIMGLESLSNKWRSFNWYVIEVDGRKIEDLIKAFDEAKQHRNAPTVIIAHTIKGEGVSFMEWVKDFHGKAPNKQQLDLALEELARSEK